MIATHTINDISFGQNTISLLIDGNKIEVTLDILSIKLRDVSDLQRTFLKFHHLVMAFIGHSSTKTSQ